MTLNIKHVVQGSIVTDDTALLDTIEAELPSEGDLVLGTEYEVERTTLYDREGNATGEERLEARMSFADDSQEFAKDADGNTVIVIDGGEPDENEMLRMNVDESTIFGPAGAATNLFNAVTTHDLASKASGWNVRVYRSPEGGVTSDDVQEWYEADESRQPRDQDSEPVEEEQLVTDDNGDPILDADGNEQYETVQVQPKYVPNTFDPSNHVIAEDSG
jgi:hypothetical protein